MTDKKYIGQITDNDVFVSIMEDLRHKNRDNHYSEYDIIKSCGLVRQLILDGGNSLAVKVKRQYNIKLTFNISKTINDTVVGDSWYKNIYPEKDEYLSSNFNDFIEVVVLKSGNYTFNVKEIIRHACHVLGGIHSGKPEDDKDEYFKNLKGVLNLESIFKFVAMESICLVVIDTLTPLENLIKNDSKDI